MNRWAILRGSLVAFVLVAPAAGQEALGPPFQVNTFTTNQQRAPAVSTDALSDEEFRIDTVTAGHQYLPAVSAQPSGGFVVTWARQESPRTTFTDVWARRYGPFGGGTGDLIFKDGFEAGP